MRPAARPAALQLRRLQRQIPTPLSLQGLSQRPGGTMQGLPMTRGGSCGRAPDPGSLMGLSEEKAEQRLGCVHTKSDSATKRITIIFTETLGGRRFTGA